MSKAGSYKELLKGVVASLPGARNRLFLLDFDGTLVEFSSDLGSVLLPDDLSRLLDRLSKITGVKLVIITGRKKQDIENLVPFPGIDIVAEHGAVIRENNVWKILKEIDTGWKLPVRQIIAKYAMALPDSFIEEKSYSLAWHYRNLADKPGWRGSKALMGELENVADSLELRIIDGNKVVEVLSKNVSKGSATVYLTTEYTFDFILSAGDDMTDEDMFTALAGTSDAFTIKVGSGKTVAKYSLPGVRQLKMLLFSLLDILESETGRQLHY